MKRDELQISLARLFKEMREKEGMTISQISKRVYIDARTWARYEDGTSAPTLPELIRIYSELGHDMLPHVLATMYPSTYSDEEMSAKEMREAVTHFFSDVADDNMVRDFYYIAFGNHGSNLKPQLAELAMLDHLPMDYRVAIVKDVITFYRMASMRGELVNPNKCPPDFDTIIYAIKKGLQAAGEHRNSYTTITED